MKKNLVLLGMMAVGKTTLGKIVAKNHGLRFIDIDTNIEKNNLMTIKEIFEKKGERYFRAIEKKIALLNLKRENSVVALGGGAFIDPYVRKEILKNCISFWLDVKIEVVLSRSKNLKKRPQKVSKVSRKGSRKSLSFVLSFLEGSGGICANPGDTWASSTNSAPIH